MFSISPYILHHLTFCALPDTATNVPRRVYSLCEADRDTERREYGVPNTSNLASKAPYKHYCSENESKSW